MTAIARQNEPVFLVGSERSGTTLVRLMLDHHPQIAFQKESEYLVDCVTDDGKFPDVGEYHFFLGMHRGFGTSKLTVDKSLSFTELARSFLEQKRAQSGGKPVLGGTVHWAFGRTLFIWPRARFIHLVRDPRDVSRSIIEMGWAGNHWAAAKRWLWPEQHWDEVRAKLTPDRWIDVRYETLVRQPKEELAKICAFLGVPYSDAMFDYTKTSTYDAPKAGLAEQWKKKARPEDIQLVEAAAGAMMAARGYELSGQPKIEVTPEMDARLMRESRRGTREFRRKRHGTALFLASAIARRAGSKWLLRKITAKTNAIDQKYVK